MSLRSIPFSIDEYYHIFNRGIDKRLVFLDIGDKKRFMRLLYLCNGSSPIVYKETKNLPLPSIETGTKLVAIGAYCLMPNHFHILVKEIGEGGTTKFMSKLLTAYSSYFNKKYDRNGALFGSKFKSSHLDTDEYLKYIYSYIHLNPIALLDPRWKQIELNKDKVDDFLNGYKECSYLDYGSEGREESCILNKLAFPEYFTNPNEFKENLFSWLSQLSKAMPWTTVDNVD